VALAKSARALNEVDERAKKHFWAEGKVFLKPSVGACAYNTERWGRRARIRLRGLRLLRKRTSLRAHFPRRR
jgi:ribosomal protein L31E